MLFTTATALPLIMACNGSRLMPPAIPIDNNDPAARDEGIAAHWLAKAVFDGTHSLSEMGERKAPNGVHITTEMCDHVGEYLSSLQCGAMEIDTGYGGQGWLVAGRADHIVFVNDLTQTLIVDDFKYGWSLVSPEMNWALISHAVGWCIKNGVAPRLIILAIHQPRPYHRDGKRREWRLTYPELMAHYARINETLSNPSDGLVTGPHCRKCPALAHCPAARAAELNAIDATEDAAFTDDITDTLLAYELDTLRTASATLKHRLDAMEELAAHRIKGGAVVPNYGVEHQFGHTRFKPDFGGSMLTVLTGVSMVKDGTVSPAEGKRRLVAAGKTKDQADAILKPLTDRPTTGVKLIRQDAATRGARLLQGKAI